MPKKNVAFKHAVALTIYLLVVWSLYRFLFRLPVEVEELLVKPVVWLLPVLYFLRKEKLGISSIGITKKNLFPAVYFALALGAVFAVEAVAINFVKYGGFDFSANIGEGALLTSLGLSFATAFSEELSFRGFIFNRAWHFFGNEWLANLITSIFWGIVHIPVAVFVWNLNPSALLTYIFLTTLFGVGSAFVFARTKNVASSILLHVLWEWPIILFR